jgi:hypothetical protein
MKRFGSPDAITTNGLRTDKAAMAVLGNQNKRR